MNAKTTLIVASIAGFAAVATAQQPTILYLPGKTIKDQNIGLRSWGSGTIRETNEAAYEGTTSISVSTRNPFQGGIMMYGTPVDLSGQFTSQDNLLRITFRLADANQVFGPNGGNGPGGPGGPGTLGGGPRGAGGLGGPGGPGGPGGLGGGRGPVGAAGAGGGGRGPAGAGGGGGVQGGGPRGPGSLGGPGGPGGPGGGTPAANPLKTIRLIVTTSDGKKSEVYIPVSSSMAGERGWRMVSIPLQAIRGLGNTNKTVKELAISADTTTTMYVGDVRVVNDSTKINGEIVQKGPYNLALGDELDLSAYGFGGSSPLKYEWDFDSKDGIQVDAEGQTVKRKFRKAGKYTITLTVSDMYGLKAPATSTLEVTVNP